MGMALDGQERRYLMKNDIVFMHLMCKLNPEACTGSDGKSLTVFSGYCSTQRDFIYLYG